MARTPSPWLAPANVAAFCAMALAIFSLAVSAFLSSGVHAYLVSISDSFARAMGGQ